MRLIMRHEPSLGNQSQSIMAVVLYNIENRERLVPLKNNGDMGLDKTHSLMRHASDRGDQSQSILDRTREQRTPLPTKIRRVVLTNCRSISSLTYPKYLQVTLSSYSLSVPPNHNHDHTIPLILFVAQFSL